MRINELLSEQQDIDEGIGSFIGKTAGALGKGVGNVQGAWQGAKDAYGQNRDRTANVAQRVVGRAGGYDPRKATGVATPAGASVPDPAASSGRPYVAPAAARTAPGAAATAPSPTGPDPKQLRQQAAELTQQADEIEQQAAASAPAAPTAAPAALPAGGKGTGQNFDAQTGKPISQYGQQQSAPAATPAPTTAPKGFTVPGAVTPTNIKYSGLAKPGAKQAPTQAELDADQASMATGSNESFHSNFLGKLI